MIKQLSKIFCLSLMLMTFSAPVQAEISFSATWRALLRMLNIDMTKEVNTIVTPPERQCVDQNVGRASASEEVPADTRTIFQESLLNSTAVVEPEEEEDTSVRGQMMSNYKKLGGDPIALEQALCFFDKNKSTNFRAAGDPSRSKGIKIDNQRYITINDLNAPLYKSRYYVIDMQTGKINTYFSGHGYGGKKGVPESDMKVEAVSNISGSNATPRGFFITGTRRNGSSDPRWKYSMKLHGLQKGVNDNSFARAVIVHPFPKMPPESASSDDPNLKGRPIDSDGPFGLSQGCPMLSEKHASEIIDKTKASSSSEGGSLLYNYSAEEKSRGAAYCGDEGLMKK